MGPVTAIEYGPTFGVEWYLEGFLGQGRTWLIPMVQLPFLIGRHENSHLHLTSSEVSRHHAEIVKQGETLWIRDLGSTNGTFLNHQRLEQDAPLANNDVLHFGSLEFRISNRAPQVQSPVRSMETGIFTGPPQLPEQFVQCTEEFEQLLRDRLVLPVYQPIITSATGVTRGYELLGRGNHPALPTEPIKLFDIAERLGKDVELSKIFRETGIVAARDLPAGIELFFNEHPSELNRPDTIGFLKELRELAPSLAMVLELNEKTVTDRQVVQELRAELIDLQIGLAYDDFGAGQARLLELIEVPPDYLKFDAFLIRDLHRQPHRFQRALASLVEMSVDLGVVPLAEGVETDEEAAACDALGFQALQGFLFGRPVPISELAIPSEH